jgi:hypothetical protein
MKVKKIKMNYWDFSLPKTGDIVVNFRKIIDRKLFMETVNICPEFVLVKNIKSSKWSSMLEVENIKTKECFTSNINSFRPITKKEKSLLALEKRLPEIEGIFLH